MMQITGWENPNDFILFLIYQQGNYIKLIVIPKAY